MFFLTSSLGKVSVLAFEEDSGSTVVPWINKLQLVSDPDSGLVLSSPSDREISEQEKWKQNLDITHREALKTKWRHWNISRRSEVLHCSPRLLVSVIPRLLSFIPQSGALSDHMTCKRAPPGSGMSLFCGILCKSTSTWIAAMKRRN